MRKITLQENRSGIRYGLLLYTVFTVGIVLSDYLQYFFAMSYWVAVSISLVLCGAAGAWMIKKGECSRFPITLGDGIVVGIFLLLSAMRSAPDNSYDVNNYHLYFQEYFGRDFVNYDFFPMRACNAHYFILGDRMLWFFRNIFGYRIGTFLNTLIIILSYFQLKDIIVQCNTGTNEKIIKGASIIVLFGLFSDHVLWNINVYYIDFLAFPFMIEALRIAVIEKEGSNKNLLWVSLMAGCAISIKMSNVVIFAFFAIIYIVRFGRSISVKPFVAGVLIVLATCGIYMYISWVITGNPVFPFANSVFESEYFSLVNSPNDYSAFNVRFGPKTLLQHLIWPVYIILHPEMSDDMPIHTGRLLLSITVVTVRCIQIWKRDRKHNAMYFALSGIWYFSYGLIMTVFNGYSRYVPVMEVLGGILVIWAIIDWYGSKKWPRVAAVVLSMVVIFQSGYLFYIYTMKDNEPAWRETALSDWSNYVANLKMVFHDHDSGVSEEITKDIDCWGIVQYNGSQAINIKDTVPVIGLTMAVTNEKTQQMADQLREEYRDSNMYTPLGMEVFDSGIAKIGDVKYQIERIIPTSPAFINVTDRMMLVQISPADQEIVTSAVSVIETEGTISLPAGVADVTLFVGHDPLASSWGSDGTDLIITADNGVQTMELFREKISVDQEYASVIIPEDFLEVGAVILKLEKDYSQNGDATGDWVKVVYQYTME